MKKVEWREFKVESLFESGNGNFDIQKDHINGRGTYVITSGISNNGVLGKSDIPAKIFDEKTITIDMFGYAFYRNFEYKMVTHARVFSLKPKFEITQNQGLFLANSFHFLHYMFGYENMCSWEKIKDIKIKLPVKNEKIDFDFMEEYITNLEKNYITKLSNYLKANELNYYILFDNKQNSIKNYNNVKFEDGDSQIINSKVAESDENIYRRINNMNKKITEKFVGDQIIKFMINKTDGNWHKEKVERNDAYKHGVDIKLVGGKRNSEYFFIECKGKSYAKSAKSINREVWLNALGQIITRMDVKRYSISKENGKISGINHAYKYGLGLYWESAQVALRRIPKEIAEVLCLHIFSVNDYGEVKYFTPSKFGTEYPKEHFFSLSSAFINSNQLK